MKQPRSRFTVVPCELDEANTFVRQHHRHHPEVVGHKFSHALALRATGEIVGVAITGRPNNEVTRNCTDGTEHACSALYGASARTAFSLGYTKLITYTGTTESGASLKAVGFKVVAEVKGRSWNCKSRPRVDKTPLQNKLRWEAPA